MDNYNLFDYSMSKLLGPNGDVFAILELGYRDLGICAVTVSIAGEGAGDPNEASCFVEAVTQCLASDM